MEHSFTENIKLILKEHFGKYSDEIFEKNLLIQYINLKTRSANKGSKARSSFANLYAIYVIIEDYLAKGFDKKGDYTEYDGALFNKLFARQRELPFGGSLQNHALNNRMNSEFAKFFPNSELMPIIRNLETKRYWINENLIKIQIGKKKTNLANSIIQIVLRPSNSHSNRWYVGILRRVIVKIREKYPEMEIIIRADGGFSCSEFYLLAEKHNLKYSIGLASNEVLKRKVSRASNAVEFLYAKQGKKHQHFMTFPYEAGSWHFSTPPSLDNFFYRTIVKNNTSLSFKIIILRLLF